jgi:hypothetical protein
MIITVLYTFYFLCTCMLVSFASLGASLFLWIVMPKMFLAWQWQYSWKKHKLIWDQAGVLHADGKKSRDIDTILQLCIAWQLRWQNMMQLLRELFKKNCVVSCILSVKRTCPIRVAWWWRNDAALSDSTFWNDNYARNYNTEDKRKHFMPNVVDEINGVEDKHVSRIFSSCVDHPSNIPSPAHSMQWLTNPLFLWFSIAFCNSIFASAIGLW